MGSHVERAEAQRHKTEHLATYIYMDPALRDQIDEIELQSWEWRIVKMAWLWLDDGLTLEEIAQLQQPPLSRERVRQLLTPLGLKGANPTRRAALANGRAEAQSKALQRKLERVEAKKRWWLEGPIADYCAHELTIQQICQKWGVFFTDLHRHLHEYGPGPIRNKNPHWSSSSKSGQGAKSRSYPDWLQALQDGETIFVPTDESRDTERVRHLLHNYARREGFKVRVRVVWKEDRHGLLAWAIS